MTVLPSISTILNRKAVMKRNSAYYCKQMPDEHFGVDIFLKSNLRRGEKLKAHWHEHFQLFCFIDGRAFLRCGSKQFQVGPGHVAVINSNEMHYLESLSDDLRFYVIRIDLPFLFSNQTDLCQTKYLVPLSQNLLTFQNLIQDDRRISDCVSELIREYGSKELGFELAVKSSVYRLIVLLLRGHVGRIMTNEEFASKQSSLRRFDSVLKYLEEHSDEAVPLDELARQANVTVSYFCRLFRQITGQTATDYRNRLRLEKSISLLKQSELNVTEIALRCGFDDVNYFSRLFRRNYRISPTDFRKNGGMLDPEYRLPDKQG